MVTDDEGLKNILINSKIVASVGVSSNEDKPSYWIFNYLMNNGYEMIPVNPTVDEVQGLKSYPDLLSITKKVDVVQVFRKPDEVPQVVETAIQIGASVIWMQVGVINHLAAQSAEAAGLKVVMDKCMRDTHRRLLSGKFSL